MSRGWLPLVVVLAACDGEGAVRLIFTQEADGDTNGFACLDPVTTRPMWERARDETDGSYPLALVVDFVALGGVPDCRASQITAWCADHECRVLPEYRRCVPIRLDSRANPGAQFRELLAAELAGLAGREVVSDAPDEPVIIRVVASAAPCEAIAADAPLACDELVGCTSSCPLVLDDLTGDVVLDLEAADNRCDDEVALCASPGLRADGACP